MSRTIRGLVALAVVALVATGCQRAADRSGADGSATAPATPSAAAHGAPSAAATEATGPVTYRYSEVPDVNPDLLSLDVYTPAGAAPA
ncbi:MAG: hypothetical protein KJ548_14310, partial [Actinobacteria bacterium]|nr:hypothetical protein [Actinomycetota bacterium]